MTKRSPDDNQLQCKTHEQRSEYDPLQAAERQTHSFNRSWLKNGESMTLTQRLGHTMFSLLYFGIGLYLLQPMMINFRSSGAISVVFTALFGLASLFFLVFGILGLRNVLRFKR
jgi:hypothetical protein